MDPVSRNLSKAVRSSRIAGRLVAPMFWVVASVGSSLPQQDSGVAAARTEWVGEVLDLLCWADGYHGEAHAACAARCLANGEGLGLWVDPVVYRIDEVQTSRALLEQLRALGGHEVRITGRLEPFSEARSAVPRDVPRELSEEEPPALPGAREPIAWVVVERVEPIEERDADGSGAAR